MKFIYKIINKICPPPAPLYGKKIFEQKSWLDKQVQEAQHKAALNQLHKLR